MDFPLCSIWYILLTVTAEARSVFDFANVRLVNGTGPYGGRVEVSINGIWGTICDDDFDMNEAKVLCRMMNLQATHFMPAAYFGQGTGPIYVTALYCRGNETHIKDCRPNSNAFCSHAEDVGILCTECPEIEVRGGEIVDVSADGTELKVKCKRKFSTSTCVGRKWSPSPLTCEVDQILEEIRLANGLGLYDGRIEVSMNGTWGTVCGTSFSGTDAGAICRMLFGTTSYIAYDTWYSYYERGTGPILIDKLGCSGSETNINECFYSLDVSCSTHYREVSLVCAGLSLNITATRLVNGTGPYDGRIELYVNGHWGTINNKYIDMYDAQTICNTHNASLAMFFKTAVYGRGAGPVHIGRLDCSNTQRDHISYCKVYTAHRSHYSYENDLSIVCTPCGLPKIYNGEPYAFNNTELTVKCQPGFFPEFIKLRCLGNRTWIEDQRCTSFSEYPLAINDVRLVDSYYESPSEGRVELLVNGTWGTVCDTDFEQEDATVICRMLGLKLKTYYLTASSFGRGSGAIFVDKLKCKGTENHINNCTYEISNYCTHYDDVSVTCTGYQLNITNIRLAGTKGPYHGRVELEVNGVWGTVCDDSFYNSEASVVCNMLGLRYKTYYHNSHYGQGSGPIYVDKLECGVGHINNCRYAVNNYYNCTHSDDASVMCYGPWLNITDARLVNGSGPFDGRAEIRVNGTWGTICDQKFDILAADLFCKLFGLRAVQVITGAAHGEGSGPIYIDQMFCKKNDVKLSDCKYLYLNECSHQRDVSVACSECGQLDLAHWNAEYVVFNGSIPYLDCSSYKMYAGMITFICDSKTNSWVTEGECKEYSYPLNISEIRLLDGPRPSSGRVEIKSLDTWGTICDDNFEMSEANVICDMIGYPPAVSFHTGAYYGEGRGPIFVDDLSCRENASHLNDCSYKTYDDCTHKSDISVVCTDCGDPTPNGGYVNSSMTSYQTTVHVTCDKHYKLIGEPYITCQKNGEWSNKPFCELIDCKDPKPLHSSRNSTDTIYGTVVQIICDEGYNIVGDAVIKCQQNGSWTDYPSCIITDCKMPKPKNGDVTLPNKRTTFGETAIIKCHMGYTPSRIGSASVSCLANGTWEVWSDCIIVDCGSPVPINGSANTTKTTYGTVVEISCLSGSAVIGEAVIICQANKLWSDTPVCDKSDCGIVSVANGRAKYKNGSTTLATIECDIGYKLNGPSFVMCILSGWNDTTVSCEIQVCYDPTPEKGKVTDTDSLNRYVFHSYAKIACNRGYQLLGQSIITCEDGEIWSNLPTCVIRDCGKLTAPANGKMIDKEGTKYKAQIRFKCNEGFFLVGKKTAKCQENGTWEHEVPQCIKQSDVGGHCKNKEYCRYDGSWCENSVCTCKTGIYDNSSYSCDIMPLLPYGKAAGDAEMSKVLSTTNVKLELGFPVFSRTHKNIYISWNGYLGLGSTNASLILDSQENIIAPFKAKIDKRRSKGVYYRSFDIYSSYEKMKENSQLISYIEMVVRKFGGLSSFDANINLIVTWDGIKHAQKRSKRKDQTSTFQAVLTSNGTKTYVCYIYGNGKMNWDVKTFTEDQVWIGYSVDNEKRSLKNKVAGLTKRFRGRRSLKTGSEKQYEKIAKGLVLTALTKLERKYENENPEVDCIIWYNKNREDRTRIAYIERMMPECPCDIRLSRFDPWFWQIGLKSQRTDETYACVDMRQVGNFGHNGKRCCYDLRSGLWLKERPHAGSFQLYNRNGYPRENIQNDATPKTKCCNQSNHCGLYYELRPTGTCYATSPYDFGTFWGDPHFRTLDGLNFTFNGLGEYVLLQVRGINTFDLQARTARLVKKDGNLSDATIFTAFAAKDSTNASVHVELNRKKNGFILYGNKIDLTKEYRDSEISDGPFEWSSKENNLIISKRMELLNVLFPLFGISLDISLGVEMLSLNTLLNKTLKGRTQGLLGNYNEDPYDDLRFPNGTVLNADISEKEVFSYGQTWEVESNNSAFLYDLEKSHVDYHNSSYMPRFLDEADPNKVEEAERVCNGSQNTQCVFDFVFTDSPEVALKTNEIKLISDESRTELDESVPFLTGCDRIKARIGEQVNCNFTADTNDEVYFVVNSVNATIDRWLSQIVYTQENENPVYIRIASRNKKGRTSPVHVINVQLCTNCNGHGRCTDTPRDDKRENEYFKIASCVCDLEYEGADCEREYDGCVSRPCSLERSCVSLSAKEQNRLGRSYNCSACPEGYTEDVEDSNECLDEDECETDAENCQHICINTIGSFECSCKDGFKTDIEDTSRCKDVNDCEEELHNCTQRCVNTEGSFNCQCYEGYKIDNDTGSCLEIDSPCHDFEYDTCSDTSGCTLVNGRPVCFCNHGYELDSTGKHCIDVDECSRGICQQGCSNTEGGFECICYPGYTLEGRTTCKECDFLHWGVNCSQDCICYGRGAEKCDNVKGCVCDDGWKGDTCDEDINECDLTPTVCVDPRKKCVNYLGTYTCECRPGFIETEYGICEDSDECQDPLLNECSQICENTLGGYSCKCNPGYTKENATSCRDIDECEIGISQCEQICKNSLGTYSCFCNYGYTLNDDRKTCTEMSDHCFEINNLTCTHFCIADRVSSQCSCRPGYILDSDNETCKDIDECDADQPKCGFATCINTLGAFLCECPVGMQLENDGITCSVCDRYHYGKNCSQTCSCLYGECNPKTGCLCDPGWTGYFCDKDINECDTGKFVCSKPNTVCVNTPGSAHCSCESGFSNASGICTGPCDVSEDMIESCGYGYICTVEDGVAVCRPKEEESDVDLLKAVGFSVAGVVLALILLVIALWLLRKSRNPQSLSLGAYLEQTFRREGDGASFIFRLQFWKRGGESEEGPSIQTSELN